MTIPFEGYRRIKITGLINAELTGEHSVTIKSPVANRRVRESNNIELIDWWCILALKLKSN
jgi:hypothetical protein